MKMDTQFFEIVLEKDQKAGKRHGKRSKSHPAFLRR